MTELEHQLWIHYKVLGELTSSQALDSAVALESMANKCNDAQYKRMLIIRKDNMLNYALLLEKAGK